MVDFCVSAHYEFYIFHFYNTPRLSKIYNRWGYIPFFSLVPAAVIVNQCTHTCIILLVEVTDTVKENVDHPCGTLLTCCLLTLHI